LSVAPGAAAPMISGADCAKTPEATVPDAALVRLAGANPAREPVSLTVSLLPRWAEVGLKLNPVAPLIAAPFAYHR
jgi:hypothetical protein